MKVKELIEYLSKCNPEYPVINSYEDNIFEVVEQRDVTDNSNSHVRIG